MFFGSHIEPCHDNHLCKIRKPIEIPVVRCQSGRWRDSLSVYPETGLQHFCNLFVRSQRWTLARQQQTRELVSVPYKRDTSEYLLGNSRNAWTTLAADHVVGMDDSFRHDLFQHPRILWNFALSVPAKVVVYR